MKRNQWAYFAGLFDGEGTFTISNNPPRNNGPSYAFREIFVTNTNLEVLEWLRDHLGGTIRVTKYAKNGWKDVYKWYVGTKQHYYVVKNMLPFLIIKKKQAKLILKFIKLKEKQKADKRGTGGLTKQEWEQRNDILQQVRVLNKRAVNTTLND